MRMNVIASIAVLSLCAVVSGALAQEGIDRQTLACENLRYQDFARNQEAPTQITRAQVVESAASLPAFCQVDGYTAPNTALQLRLPMQDWNGKFFFAGCGGSCGEVEPEVCNYPLQRGYACIVSDSGHRSTGEDGLWAYFNLAAKVDFGFRATHRTTVAGKMITHAFYQVPPKFSYFMGCSTGGRQALIEAQSFPTDFDGIIAGGSVISEAGTDMSFLWNLAKSIDEFGKPMFTPADLKLVNDAVIAAGDMQDGVKDAIIPDPRTVDFDPDDLVCGKATKGACLSEAQSQAVKALYGGPVTSQGIPTYHGGGLQPGSELNWEAFLPLDGKRASADVSASDTARYILTDWGPNWTFTDFDFDVDSKRIIEMDRLYAASNPDLRDFKSAGGKLIMYQGWNDPMVVPLNSVDYYETVEKTMGGRSETQEFFRLFMVPGMNHCVGGPGATAIDYIEALEKWVEEGKAPDRLLASHIRIDTKKRRVTDPFPLDPDHVTFTRPVFPYPLKAHYSGQGNPDDAANWDAR